MREYVGSICPFCGNALVEDDVVAFCGSCGKPHHLKCWQTNFGCATPGCSGSIVEIVNADKFNANPAPVQPAAPAFVEQPAAPEFVEQPVMPQFVEQPAAPDFVEQPVAPEFAEQPAMPQFVEQPAAPAFVEQPAAPEFAEQPVMPQFVEQPVAPEFAEQPMPQFAGQPNQQMYNQAAFQNGMNQYMGMEAQQAGKVKAPKKKKKGLKITIICLIIAATLGVGGFFGYTWLEPKLKNSKAEKYLEKGEYKKAWKLFNELGYDYDGYEKANKCMYLSGKDKMENGDYQGAIHDFELADEYEDSEELIEKCVESKGLEEATKLYNDGNYDEALDVLHKMDSTSKVEEWINKCTFAKGELYLDAGRFDEAIEIFESIKSYEGAQDKINETKYTMAEKELSSGNYDEAQKIFASIPKSYEDAQDKAKYCVYVKGCELLTNGKYEEASKVLSDYSLKGYKDTADKIDEATYGMAMEFFNAKKYTDSMNTFARIKTYSNSEEMYNESKYQLALECMAKKDYIAAVNYFNELGKYKDSKTKVNEAKYAYVKATLKKADASTLQFLDDLVAAKYSDAKQIKENLTNWSAKIVFNTSQKDETTSSKQVSRTKTFYAHVTLTGKNKSDSTKLRYEFVWPNGQVSAYDWTGVWKDGYSGYASFWYTNPSQGATGKGTLKIFDGNGIVIGTKTVEITE